MKFLLEFACNSDAFLIGDEEFEIVRIVRQIADRVEDGESIGTVRDINGNTVGAYTLLEP